MSPLVLKIINSCLCLGILAKLASPRPTEDMPSRQDTKKRARRPRPRLQHQAGSCAVLALGPSVKDWILSAKDTLKISLKSLKHSRFVIARQRKGGSNNHLLAGISGHHNHHIYCHRCENAGQPTLPSFSLLKGLLLPMILLMVMRWTVACFAPPPSSFCSHRRERVRGDKGVKHLESTFLGRSVFRHFGLGSLVSHQT